MKTHYKWLLIGTALGLLAITIALAKPTTEQKQSIVQLFVINSSNEWISSGSGTLIYDSKHILTNYHVIEDAITNSDYEILVCFNLSDEDPPACLAKATLLKAKTTGEASTYEETFDLAVLEITTGIMDGKEEKFDSFQIKYNLFLPHIKIDTNNFTEYPVEIGDSVEILGYPAVGGETITYTEGKVSGFESLDSDSGQSLPYLIKTNATVNPGNSGGGAFDTEQNFIGVPSMVFADIGGSIGYIISLPAVNAFLSQVTLRYCDSYDGNNHCVCRYGYKIDSTDTKCVKDSAINNLYEKQEQTLPESQQIWGCAENMTINPADGLCYANKGYMWSNSKNAYVTYTEACQEEYGKHSYSAGDANADGSTDCYCEEGYTWNSNQTACIKGKNTSTPDTKRQTSFAQDIFTDASTTHPFYDAISFVKQNGIVAGYDDGTFKPDNKINRAEFTKILVQTAYPEEIVSYSSKACFKDITDSAWFTKYVCLAKEKGVISGYSDNTFQPNKYINVAEALKITLEALYGNIPAIEGPWYQKYVDYANARGVMLGEWRDINKEITRGEMAEFIYRIKQPQS